MDLPKSNGETPSVKQPEKGDTMFAARVAALAREKEVQKLRTLSHIHPTPKEIYPPFPGEAVNQEDVQRQVVKDGKRPQTQKETRKDKRPRTAPVTTPKHSLYHGTVLEQQSLENKFHYVQSLCPTSDWAKIDAMNDEAFLAEWVSREAEITSFRAHAVYRAKSGFNNKERMDELRDAKEEARLAEILLAKAKEDHAAELASLKKTHEREIHELKLQMEEMANREAEIITRSREQGVKEGQKQAFHSTAGHEFVAQIREHTRLATLHSKDLLDVAARGGFFYFDFLTQAFKAWKETGNSAEDWDLFKTLESAPDCEFLKPHEGSTEFLTAPPEKLVDLVEESIREATLKERAASSAMIKELLAAGEGSTSSDGVDLQQEHTPNPLDQLNPPSQNVPPSPPKTVEDPLP